MVRCPACDLEYDQDERGPVCPNGHPLPDLPPTPPESAVPSPEGITLPYQIPSSTKPFENITEDEAYAEQIQESDLYAALIDEANPDGPTYLPAKTGQLQTTETRDGRLVFVELQQRHELGNDRTASCPHCGNDLTSHDEANYCPFCGKSIEGVDVSDFVGFIRNTVTAYFTDGDFVRVAIYHEFQYAPTYGAGVIYEHDGISITSREIWIS